MHAVVAWLSAAAVQVELLEDQASRGSAAAAIRVAQHKYHGTHGVDKNTSEAVEAFQQVTGAGLDVADWSVVQAADLGDDLALVNMGYMLANGWGGQVWPSAHLSDRN